MQITALSNDEIKVLLGEEAFTAWSELNTYLTDHYIMDVLWGTGGKYGTYECKYRKGGKTLVTLYAKERCFDLLLIFGKDERDKFEAERASFSEEIQAIYDQAKTFHDGKWMFITLIDRHLNTELKKMLHIKKKPTK